MCCWTWKDDPMYANLGYMYCDNIQKQKMKNRGKARVEKNSYDVPFIV